MKHPTAGVLLAAVVATWTAPCGSAPSATPSGLYYPLDGMCSEVDFAKQVLSGGCWLAGLPGFPAYNGRNAHAGIDLRAGLGDSVYAMGPGVVHPWSDTPHRGYGAGWSPGYAVIVRGRSPGGGNYHIIYGHTRNHRVRGGEQVVPGQPLAEIGPWLPEDGGPHLHLTVRLGDLPTQGWGTPTIGPQPSRPGAECVLAPLDVVLLGYRDPRRFLRGETEMELLVGAGAEPAQSAILGQRYLTGYRQVGASEDGVTQCAVVNAIGLPFAHSGWQSHWVQKCAQGCLQTFRTDDHEEGALLLQDGSPRAFWVHGPIWTSYAGKGGPRRFGYPVGEETTVDGGVTQRFERASITWRRTLGPVVVPH